MCRSRVNGMDVTAVAIFVPQAWCVCCNSFGVQPRGGEWTKNKVAFRLSPIACLDSICAAFAARLMLFATSNFRDSKFDLLNPSSILRNMAFEQITINYNPPSEFIPYYVSTNKVFGSGSGHAHMHA